MHNNDLHTDKSLLCYYIATCDCLSKNPTCLHTN